jgi:hypothetical protein
MRGGVSRARLARWQNPEKKGISVGSITCGAVRASFALRNDGIALGKFAGLATAVSAPAASGMLLVAATERGAVGLVCDVRSAAMALPPIAPRHYAYVPPGLSRVPVAVVALPEQMHLYARQAASAATIGAMRRAFLCPEQARAWVAQEARVALDQARWSTEHLEHHAALRRR